MTTENLRRGRSATSRHTRVMTSFSADELALLQSLADDFGSTLAGVCRAIVRVAAQDNYKATREALSGSLLDRRVP